MAATSILFLPPRFNRRRITMQNIPTSSSFIRSVLADNNLLDASASKTTSYNDNWFDRLAINHLSKSLQSATGSSSSYISPSYIYGQRYKRTPKAYPNFGLRSSKGGYDGLVEAASMALKQFNPFQQKQLVMETLQMAIPSPILLLIKTVLPPSKFAREYFAVFTTIFFAWLVGPCQVKESEFEGRKEKNVVYVPKCRFLSETNCVGMCTNLCKMPSQSFIKDSLGMPFNMVPNFEDMSCEMIFGVEPPPQSLDPAFNQPCYKLCKSKQRHHDKCAN